MNTPYQLPADAAERIAFLDRLYSAVRLAEDNPDLPVQVLQIQTADGRTRFTAVLPGQPAPAGASLACQVIRKKPDLERGEPWGERAAIRHVMRHLPEGESLYPCMLANHYPQSEFERRLNRPRGVHSYDIFTQSGRNVATWLPHWDSAPMIHTGPDNCGRQHKAFVNGELHGPIANIEFAIELAQERFATEALNSADDSGRCLDAQRGG